MYMITKLSSDEKKLEIPQQFLMACYTFEELLNTVRHYLKKK